MGKNKEESEESEPDSCKIESENHKEIEEES